MVKKTSVGDSRPSTFADQIYGHILHDIAMGAFPVASRLPTEKQLSERFAVSRPVVREALARLQRDGLVESRRGSGSYVRASPPEDLSLAADMERIARYQRFQDFRLVVEGAAAALAAENRSEKELSRIIDAHRQFMAEIADGLFLWQSDRALHLAIAAATGNEFFATSLDASDVGLSDFMNVSLKLTSSRSPQRGQVVSREHGDIVDAIAAKDRKAAQVAMEHHIIQARRRMMDRTVSP